MSTATLAPSKPLRAVIVDDTEDLRDLLRLALVRGGMRVVGEAGDGLAGIEAVRSTRPDVILLDLSMPVMDGLEALPTMRSLVPEARIIVLSGFGASAMSERALAIGADAYLQKGASLGRILDHIRDVVEGRAATAHRPVPEQPVEPAPAAPSRTTPSAAWDVLAMAPFGVVEVEDEPPYRVVHANPACELLLGAPVDPGTPLVGVAPALATTVIDNRLRGDLDFESSATAGPVQVSLRHTSASLLLYLRPITDEVNVLRSAIATTA
ncbi:MAG: response regulator transcription factor, partial [Marmoricola sp.]